MDFRVELLSKEHSPMVNDFTCVESRESLSTCNSDTRRRIIRHSREMDNFLKREAIGEQNLNLNTTHMFINPENNEFMGFVSLCSDSIPLELSERARYNISYQNVPALKIARLATNNNYKHRGVGKLLIKYSAYVALKMRGHCGIKFLTLDCYEHRVSFYEAEGFKRNLIQPVHLEYDSPISMRLHLDDYFEKIAN